MKPKTYTCENFPRLSIGSTKAREIKFRDGKFVAREKWQVELIEGNEWFGCFIFPAEEPAEPVVEPVVEEVVEEVTEEVTEEEEEIAEPEYPSDIKVSDSALRILNEAGIAVEVGALKLGLADGDRLTVKMAERLVSDG